MYDVAIIGAGVVGGIIARELSRYDLKICILEKENDVAMGASKANSAIVHAGFDAKTGTLKALLNVRGVELYEKLCAELGVKYNRIGALVVGREDEIDIINTLAERGRANNVPGIRVVRGEELHRMEPMLHEEITCAMYAPTSAITSPYELTIAAVGNAMDNGAALRRDFCVRAIVRTEDGYELLSGAEKIETKFYINCAGLHSGEVNALSGGEDMQGIPRAGEYMILDRECGELVHHTVFPTPTKHGKGILVTPTVDGNLLLGPTSIERENRDDTSTTAEGLNGVIEKTKKTFAGLPYGKVITSFTGLRSVDDDFIIEPGNCCVNLMRIGSPGLSAAPAIAEYVVGMLGDMGLEMVKKADFNPCRRGMHAVSEMSAEERNRLIHTNPAYGKMVCRCESVSEGEVVDAIRNNPGARDLDGVKRRTRSGMGRCQGGFCSPQVLEILARELRVSPESITKSGGNSYILTGKTKEGLK